MKIYTKTGDKGKTSLIGGVKVDKSDLRIESYGTVDELNSHIGMIRDHSDEQYSELLREVQDRLFTIGAHLATAPEKKGMQLPDLHESDVQHLEEAMDQMDADLPELRSFLLPGGHPEVSQIHIARCVCRRAERIVVNLDRIQSVEPEIIKYLNRLSDFLFVYSRYRALQLKVDEVTWRPRK